MDVGEKALSGTGNPRFRDEATIPWCLWFFAQEVDDAVEHLWREVRDRHWGFREEAKASA